MPEADPRLVGTAFRWMLKLDQLNVANFTKCSGLGKRVEPIAHREAGENQTTRYFPGRVETDPVSCYYGVTKSTELFEWASSCLNGDLQRRPAALILLDLRGSTELLRYKLENVWCTGWSGAHLDTLENRMAIECITLCCEDITMELAS